ncbi:MAG: hypothetical protein JZU52_12640 [Lamprocystis purpurea]|uniref:hypothetical protein n=1 Tax=Lamprocystis purpurea TaxID=61598 RepID=UPI00037B23CC|nr:hypothetical protein [Lamprocystis purpurea]MBV5274443.1 hypothetical protein [Lamprocystis purpurea]
MSEPAIRKITPQMIPGEIDRIKQERREGFSGLLAAQEAAQRLRKIEQLQYEAETHLCAAQACFDAIALLT